MSASDAVGEGVAVASASSHSSLRRRIEALTSVSSLPRRPHSPNRCGGVDGLQSIGAIGLSVDPA